MDNKTFANQVLEPKRTGNLIQDLNPLTKLNVFLIFGLSAFFVGGFYYSFGMIIFLLLLAAFARCFGSFLKVYWKVLLMFGLFLFAIKAAFAPGETIIWQKWGIHITVESIQAALLLASSVCAFCGAVIMFAQTTEWSSLTYALEKKGVSHITSFAILSSLQTISDLGVNARVIMDSQKARGIETEGNLIQRIKAYIPVMGPLILNAISSVEEKSIAMDARAFSAPGKHSMLVDLPEVTIAEKTFAILVDVLFIAAVVWRIVSWRI